MTYRVWLDVTNLLSDDPEADGVVHLHEALCGVVLGLPEVTFDIGRMVNEFGSPVVPFEGTREALEALVDRYEEDVDLRSQLYDWIEEVVSP